MNLHIHSSKDALAEAFAAYIAQQVQKKESYSIALSGGSTPKVLFQKLASDYKTLDWSKVKLFWGDERMVPPDHDESNFKMTKDFLLDHIDIPAENVFRVMGENEEEEEVKRYEEVLKANLPQQNGLPQFDLVILGMGEDGHTASIFPHQMELLTVDQICALATHPESGQKRVTLTGVMINNGAEVAFLVTGVGKAEKVAAIVNKEGIATFYPAAHIHPKEGQLNWWLDDSAALNIKH
ncbi:MAG: 6-phosphogluconolactonase [Bacteroidota bacterium]